MSSSFSEREDSIRTVFSHLSNWNVNPPDKHEGLFRELVFWGVLLSVSLLTRHPNYEKYPPAPEDSE